MHRDFSHQVLCTTPFLTSVVNGIWSSTSTMRRILILRRQMISWALHRWSASSSGRWKVDTIQHRKLRRERRESLFTDRRLWLNELLGFRILITLLCGSADFARSAHQRCLQYFSVDNGFCFFWSTDRGNHERASEWQACMESSCSHVFNWRSPRITALDFWSNKRILRGFTSYKRQNRLVILFLLCESRLFRRFTLLLRRTTRFGRPLHTYANIHSNT